MEIRDPQLTRRDNRDKACQSNEIANMGSDKAEKKMRKLRERAEQLEAQALELTKEAEQVRAQLTALEETQTDVSAL